MLWLVIAALNGLPPDDGADAGVDVDVDVDASVAAGVDPRLEPEAASATSWNTVVMASSRITTAASASTVPVQTIDRRQLEGGMHGSMVELLTEQPGIRTLYTYHSPLLMRGFAGNNLVFLVDGCVRTSNTPEGHRWNRLNPFVIREVQIIKGPGSVLFGSGALTGLVHVLTDSPFDRTGLTFRAAQQYATNDNARDSFLEAGYGEGSVAGLVSARFRSTDDFRFPDGTSAAHSDTQDRDVVTKVGFRPSEVLELLLTSDLHFGGPWAKAAGFNGKDNLEVYAEQEDTLHHAVSLRARPTAWVDELRTTVFVDVERTRTGKRWTDALDRVTSDSRTDLRDVYGGATLLVSRALGRHALTAGLDVYSFRAWVETSEYDALLSTTPTTVSRSSTQGGGTDAAGVFAQDEVQLGPHRLVLGLRGDGARSLEGSVHGGSIDTAAYAPVKSQLALSAHLGGIFELAPWLHATANLGRAFRMPGYLELYGETLTGKGIVSGNPALAPEYSVNLDSGLRLEVAGLTARLDAFANLYTGLIQKVAREGGAGDAGLTYQNLATARVFGGEASVAWPVRLAFVSTSTTLTPSASLTAYRGDDLSGASSVVAPGTPLDAFPGHALRVSLEATSRLGPLRGYVSATVLSSFSQDRQPAGVLADEAYTVVGLRFGVTLRESEHQREFRLALAVDNLLNATYRPLRSPLPAKGRDLKLSLQARF